MSLSLSVYQDGGSGQRKVGDQTHFPPAPAGPAEAGALPSLGQGLGGGGARRSGPPSREARRARGTKDLERKREKERKETKKKEKKRKRKKEKKKGKNKKER
ncbi:unnamed protein product [Nyctereutes procyonoides]|uniref:(raccoon dog) hypothetical protein n=1 Tax=Nyctereutes procyonoides TaxID=34880 RepID=A0A811YW79_NYCPR|nr:unnamed protein product [Nyctereutes procyonoides]CAD7679467.1 unnamed protein product [Nyctereutes procyonoides]